MAACPACGATIQHGVIAESDKVIPLEVFTEPDGDSRYRVIDANALPVGGTRLLIEPVRADAPISAYPDHRKDCPGYGNGK